MSLTTKRRAFLATVTTGFASSLAGCGTRTASDPIATAPSGHWPTRDHDSHNTGYSPRATPPEEKPTVVWRTTELTRYSDAAVTAGRFSRPTPIVMDGRLFVGGEAITCYDATTGERQWRCNRDNRFVVGCVHTDRGLCVVERAKTTLSGSYWPRGSFGLVDPATGTVEHTVSCGLGPSAPVTDGRLVVVPTQHGHVGFAADGTRRWRVVNENATEPPAPAAVTDDSLSLPMPTTVGYYDRTDGWLAHLLPEPTRQWKRRPGPRRRWRSPVVTGDGVVVPTVRLVNTFEPESSAIAPGLHCFGVDGERRWHRPVPTKWMTDGGPLGSFEQSVSSPAVADGVGYVVSARIPPRDDGFPERTNTTLQAFETATGAERWRRTFPGEGTRAVAPLVADDRVYVALPLDREGGGTGRVVAFDTPGDRLWSVDVPGVPVHLAAVGDLLYVTLARGRVIAYGAA